MTTLTATEEGIFLPEQPVAPFAAQDKALLRTPRGLLLAIYGLIPACMLSALTFYISHDINRSAAKVKHIIYHPLRFLRIPVYVLCPVVAMLLAFPVTYYGQQDAAYRIAMSMGLFHMYTDRFVWKKGLLHRDYIRMR